MPSFRTLLPVLIVALCAHSTAALAISEIIPLERAKRGTVEFTHRRHAYDLGVECNRCHHNISKIRAGDTTCKGCHTDQQHSGLCHQCHLSNRDSDYDERILEVRQQLGRETVPSLFKAFHNLCRNCHAQVNKAGKGHAPYECAGCHR